MAAAAAPVPADDRKLLAWRTRAEHGFTEMIEAFRALHLNPQKGGKEDPRDLDGWTIEASGEEKWGAQKRREASEAGLSRADLVKKIVSGEEMHRLGARAVVEGDWDELVALTTGVARVGEYDPLFRGGKVLETVTLPPVEQLEEVVEEDKAVDVDRVSKSEETTEFERAPLSADVAVARYSMGVPFVSDREFLWLEVVRDYDIVDGQKDVRVVQVFSVEEDDGRQPPPSGVVRGKVISSGWVISRDRDAPEKILLVYLVQMDVCGWIPKWVINNFSQDDTMLFALSKLANQKLRETSGE
jgi:START domain